MGNSQQQVMYNEYNSAMNINYTGGSNNNMVTTSHTYPHSPDYTYTSRIAIINLDEECERDIAESNGFIVEPSGRNIKKDIRAENGIYSPKFGQTLADATPFIDRYKCRCKDGKGLRGRINAGLRCPICGHLCEFVDDNFSYFGWIKLKEHCIIHPSVYKKLESFMGKGIPIQGQKRTKIENILDITDNQAPLTGKMKMKKAKEEPFFGIGMINFVERFDEIMDFYLKSRPNKKIYYDDIYSIRDRVFTHSIPVFTTLLRPFDISDGNMVYEPCNAIYSMMNKLATMINKNATKIQREPKVKNQQLFNLQTKFMELYGELENILSGKKGDFRCLLGGRYNFSSRNVIVQDPSLRIDQVTLPIVGLTILFEQRIKNILMRMYNMTPTEANDIWYKATIEPNKRINMIVQSIIDDYKNKGLPGVPVIINRNPTIAYGGILQMFCVGFTNSYTMAVPLQCLKFLAADFDGDVLNILLPINQTFTRLAWEKFNPRNCMYIDRNNGQFNVDACMSRDTLINANGLSRLGRDTYSNEEQNNWNRLMELKKSVV